MRRFCFLSLAALALAGCANVPMSAEDLLESAVLVYLQGLGINTAA